MLEKIEQIEDRLKQLDILIKETKGRLPAHSTKPPVMMDLLNLEDEYDQLQEQLKQLMKTGNC